MPSREIQIPLFLWIATAIIVHLFWGGGTHQAALVLEEKAALRGFAARIQHEVQAELRPIPIAMLESDVSDPSKPEVEEALEPEDPDKLDEEEKKKIRKPEATPEPKPEEKKEPPPLSQSQRKRKSRRPNQSRRKRRI